ncbi:MAG: TonB-dependent receptor domain-containing protein [Vicinamibacterales bacterium]
MARIGALCMAAALVGLTAVPGSAQQTLRPASVLAARLPLGGIQGTVVDDRGAPLAGAMVSALGGPLSGMAVTDGRGRYVISSLPAGDYMLRIHMAGFVSARYDRVRVGSARASVDAIRLHRVVLAAGVVAAGDDPADGGDDHSEVAWRLRHIKRSILKDDNGVSIADAAAGEALPDSGSLFGRAFDGAASLATSFFADTPFSGEVNLLTSSALGGGLFGASSLPNGIAYIAIGAPAASWRWDVRASMSQSDLTAWIVAGSFASHAVSDHDYDLGVTYSTQLYQNRDVLPLAPASQFDTSRVVGELYGSDHWTLSPSLAVEYGARYGRYDYLPNQALISPHASVSVTPAADTHVTASVAERMMAPGAEEFAAPATVGPWLPPERMFAPFGGGDFSVEQTRTLDVGLDHTFAHTYVVDVRRFQQTVDNQQAVLFGLPTAGGPESPGHYFVANVGGVDADGWAFGIGTDPSQRVRASIDYSVTHAHWLSRGDLDAVALVVPDVERPQNENIQDVTTRVETDFPETSTHLFVVYKLNTAFARPDESARAPVDYRFDVQVNQALPFVPFGARWEVLVGIRDLFRDPSEPGSPYDELLVIRPPKRVIGGVLIKF